jgi:NAD(P)H dehydrogenase (quinone)
MEMIAGSLSAATGTHTTYHDRSEQEQRGILAAAGIPPFFVDVLVFLDKNIHSNSAAAPTDTFHQLTGRTPRTVEAWIEENVSLFTTDGK